MALRPHLWLLLVLAPACSKDDASDTAPDPSGEVCNGLDDDGDTRVDEGLDTPPRYRDSDGDGLGDPGVSTTSCAELPGYVGNDEDCDDSDATVGGAGAGGC